MAFVVDMFSRAIVGWSAATTKRAKLVLDAVDMALWRRDSAGTPAGPGLVHHADAGSPELIKPRKPWHGLADVELATAERVDWFNNQRLHTAVGDIPPHEHETNYYAQHQPQPAAGVNA